MASNDSRSQAASTKIKRDFGRDNSSMEVPNAKTGKSMGGSTTNVGHSISGGSVPKGTD